MASEDFQQIITTAWENRQNLNSSTGVERVRTAIKEVLHQLNNGTLRVAEKQSETWVVNLWIKQAIMLSFMLTDSEVLDFSGEKYFDKVPLRCSNFSKQDFVDAGFRVVPGAKIRHGTYLGKGAVVMPSFINIGAYIGEGTLIDTWATVGSCAQVGKNCHISGGVGIGGVLEPIQAQPVIIEDDVFIGARSEIAEGVIIEEGAVLGMGVYIGASTKIYNRETGEVSYGKVPAYSVVVPGTLPSNKGDCGLYAAIIVKQVDEKTKSKTSINELLRN